MTRVRLGMELHHHGNSITCLDCGMAYCWAGCRCWGEMLCPGWCCHLSEDISLLRTANSQSPHIISKCSIQGKIRMTIYLMPVGWWVLCRLSIYDSYYNSLRKVLFFLFIGRKLGLREENGLAHSHM